MKVRIETSSLASATMSGVGYYVKRLTEALDDAPNVTVYSSCFNFLHRQTTQTLDISKPTELNPLIPLRVYAKLQSYSIAPPFDVFKRAVDLTIFPNFATWPTLKSNLRATVIHDLTYLYFPEVVESKNLEHLRRVVPKSIKEADFIITVSESVKAEIIKEFKLKPENCLVTPIPPEASFYKKNNNEVHRKYGIPTKKYIYFIGNLEPRKNLPTLIAAYRLLPENIRSEYSLIMAGGNGWKTEASKAAIEDAQRSGENVVHIGYVDQADSSALFQKSSLFVMPSTYEGFGMPILEAMAGDTPVVASDIPVLRETAGEAALYANPESPADFRDKILEVISKPNLVESLNKQAQKQLKKISWQDNADRITKYVNLRLKQKYESN